MIVARFLDDRSVSIKRHLRHEYLSLSKDSPLKKRIDFVITRLKENPSFGQPISKKLIPREYRAQGIDSAFWVNLSESKGWRLIYSLTSENPTEILAIIVEWFEKHKDYEKRFGYK